MAGGRGRERCEGIGNNVVAESGWVARGGGWRAARIGRAGLPSPAITSTAAATASSGVISPVSITESVVSTMLTGAAPTTSPAAAGRGGVNGTGVGLPAGAGAGAPARPRLVDIGLHHNLFCGCIAGGSHGSGPLLGNVLSSDLIGRFKCTLLSHQVACLLPAWSRTRTCF